MTKTLQRLPKLPGYYPANDYRRPTYTHLQRYDDPQDIVEIMADSLSSGLAGLQGIEVEPLLAENYPEAFEPSPGRCLWTWDDLYRFHDKDPELVVNRDPLLNLSLRPSDEMPEHLRSVSPRFAWTLTNMRIAELLRVIQRVCEEDGLPAPPSYNTFKGALLSMTYGAPLDERIPRETEVITPPRNSRRSALHEHALHASKPPKRVIVGHPTQYDSSGSPLAAVHVAHPPFNADVLVRLESIAAHAVEALQKHVAEALKLIDKHGDEEGGPRWPMLEYATTMNVHRILPQARLDFILGSWDFTGINDPMLTIEEALRMALVRCMVREHAKSEVTKRTCDAGTMLALSRLTGLPVTVFIRYGIAQLKRCYFTGIEEGEVALVYEALRRQIVKTQAQKARLDELLSEINKLSKELADTRDNLPVAKVDDVWQAMTYTSMPAWGVYSAEEAGFFSSEGKNTL